MQHSLRSFETALYSLISFAIERFSLPNIIPKQHPALDPSHQETHPLETSL